jgi:hypothetical protein
VSERKASGQKAGDRKGLPLQDTTLDREFAQEKAATLRRLGQALELALSALAQVDPAKRDRERLLEEAGLALWQFVVQREACGLRDLSYVLRDYRVPPEVVARMGVMPARDINTHTPHER